MEQEKEFFQDWVYDHFAYALHNNVELEYSTDELVTAKRCLTKRSLNAFPVDLRENITKALACVIRSINNTLREIQAGPDKTLIHDSKLHDVFDALLNNKIRKISFGAKNAIELTGPDVQAVKEMFFSWYAKGKIKPKIKYEPGTIGALVQKNQNSITKAAKRTRYKYAVTNGLYSSLHAINGKTNYQPIASLLYKTGLCDKIPTAGTIQKDIGKT